MISKKVNPGMANDAEQFVSQYRADPSAQTNEGKGGAPRNIRIATKYNFFVFHSSMHAQVVLSVCDVVSKLHQRQMACCPGRVYTCCESGLSSCRTDSYDVAITSATGPITVAALRPGGYYITLQHASIVQVSFSGTIQGIETPVLQTAAPSETSGTAGFFLGMYNVLGTVYSETTTSKTSYGTVSGSTSIPVSVKSAWPLCAGTYVINVYVFQNSGGSLAAVEASGDLCIVMTKK